MKKLKIGLNGFGRIGRNASRIILENKELELAAINSRSDAASHAYLLKYDSTYGTLPYEITSGKDFISVEGHKIKVFSKNLPSEIPWEDAGVDIVIDATGKFRTSTDLEGHIRDGVRYVVLSSPAKDDTKTLVMGVNHLEFDSSKNFIVSNSSCTTNCLATMVKVLQDNFGIRRAFMTTTHAVTDSQNLLDNSHSKEVRLRRSALTSMIPASTGSAKDIIKLFPILSGKIICQAIRIPTTTVSMINIVAQLNEKISKENLDTAFIKAGDTNLKNILKVADGELVSIDYKGSRFSSIYDKYLTSVIEGDMVNLYAWYDNEWGYSSRLVDLCEFIGKEGGMI